MTATPQLEGTYLLDRGHSSVRFAVRHMKVSTFRASFGDIAGRLHTDGGKVALEAIARAESVSIASPPELREHVVQGADFFQAGEHPELEFRSTDVELRGDGTARVTGELTVLGWDVELSASLELVKAA